MSIRKRIAYIIIMAIIDMVFPNKGYGAPAQQRNALFREAGSGIVRSE